MHTFNIRGKPKAKLSCSPPTNPIGDPKKKKKHFAMQFLSLSSLPINKILEPHKEIKKCPFIPT